MKKPDAGTRVRLTGDFLRNTGQIVGGEGQQRWYTLECDCGLCRTGDFVAVDEESVFEQGRARHLNRHNLEKVPGARRADFPPSAERAFNNRHED